MFIFNDVRKIFVRPQKSCTVNVSEEVCETQFNGSMIFKMAVSYDKEVYWLLVHSTLITSPGLEAKG